MYFTREDNPHSAKSDLQADVVSKFKDLGNIELSIMSFKKDFEFCKFYSVTSGVFIHKMSNGTRVEES